MSFNNILEILRTIFAYTIVRIAVVIILAVFLNKLIKSIVNKLFSPRSSDKARNLILLQKNRETASRVILASVKIFIWVVAIIMIFSMLNIDTNSILAGAGFFGLIVGLGTKTLIENLVTGFFLIADGNISIGDYVRINNFKGVVHDISVRNIIIQSNTGELSIIPVTNIKELINYSMDLLKILVILEIPIEYGFMKIINTLNKSIKEMTYIDTVTEPVISGYNLHEGNYEIRISCEVVSGTNIATEALIKGELIKALKEAEIKVNSKDNL